MAHATLQKIVPSLPVNNVKETIDYYCNKLGFAHQWFYGDPVEEGGCRRDEIHLMFLQDADQALLCKGLNLLFFVHKIETLFDELTTKGVIISSPIQNYEHGMREFAVTDCNGYTLRFAENHH